VRTSIGASQMQHLFNRKLSLPLFARLLASVACIAVISNIGFLEETHNAAQAETNTTLASDPAQNAAGSGAETVELTQEQLHTVKIETIGTHSFRVEKEVIGSVAYHEAGGNGEARAPAGSKFIVGNVPESDSPAIRIGQDVEATMSAYPESVFMGKVSTVGVTVYDSGGNPAVDPNTHRITVRCKVADPQDKLFPGMLGSLVIQVGSPLLSVAIPQNGVVREGDGTMSVWVTGDRRHFTRRIVKVGLRQDGYDQILDGLQPGELAVTSGGVFVSNIVYALAAQ